MFHESVISILNWAVLTPPCSLSVQSRGKTGNRNPARLPSRSPRFSCRKSGLRSQYDSLSLFYHVWEERVIVLGGIRAGEQVIGKQFLRLR